jgi:drug/metabolite transporter (DMT)-like permease
MTQPDGPGRQHWRAEASIAMVAFIWGATFVVVKEALNDASTLVFLALRFSMAAAILAAALWSRLRRPAEAGTANREISGGLLCGALLFLGYALQTAGLRLTTASKSAFITGLYVVLVPLLGSAVHRVVPRLAEAVAVVLALAGTALISTTGLDFRLGAGDLLTAGCAVAFAAHILAVAHFTKHVSYERLSLYQVAAVAVLSGLAVAVGLETPRVTLTKGLLLALATTAVLATALCFLLYTWAQKHTSATRSALIFALEPVFAGLVAWWVAGESWTGRSLAGAGLILGGIVLSEVQPGRRETHLEI